MHSKPLERDELWFDRRPALAFCLSMIFFGKPDSTFSDHALTHSGREYLRRTSQAKIQAGPNGRYGGRYPAASWRK
jgi:hypothetical protein